MSMEILSITNSINELFITNPYLAAFAAFGFLFILAAITNFIIKRLLLRFIQQVLRHTRFGNDQELTRHGVISRLSNIVPALIIAHGATLIPNMPEALQIIIKNVVGAFIILTVALAISSGLNVINTLYMRRADAGTKPIKGYLQVVKIILFFITVILIIATLIDKSPVILLSGLGALAAVLMLVFQDTLLSLVASIQISSSDMLRVGDWIEMPNLNADGDVIDIALHTVKVQNWDKTITTLPTRRLVSDPFKNWRGMQESGGRRIKRALHLDQESIRFLTEEEKKRLKRFTLLTEYMETKQQELDEWNERLGESRSDAVNTRRLTNIGTFRAYVQRYLEAHHHIRNDMTLLVRQLAPGPEGLPLEIYCFTNTVVWAQYESIQSDLFDHLYCILPEFGLRTYQQPSGADLQSVVARLAIAPATNS